MFKKKEEKEEKTIIKTSERWRTFSNGTKWAGIIIISCMGVYLLFLLFNVYVFGSLILSFIISSVIFYNIVDVPSERFVESRIEIKDKDGKQTRNHIFNEFKIPINLLKEFTLKGENIVKFKTKSGATINIVNKIDFDNKIIYFPWFSNLSDWNFLIDEKTFKFCVEKLEELTIESRKNKLARPIIFKLEHLYMLKETTKDIDIKDEEKDLLANLRNLFGEDYAEGIE